MKKRGYIAAIRGDMVHIMQCAPVSFTLRTEKYCYEQAPVTVNNESYFLQPRTHILIKNGTQIECNNVIPVMVELGGKWIQFTPEPRPAQTPHKLHPHTKRDWVYEEIKNPAEKGLYSYSDVQRLVKDFLFPIEKEAVLSGITRTITGVKNVYQEGLKSLIEPGFLDYMWNNLKEKFWSFSLISAGCIGLVCGFMIFRGIVDTILNAFQLHNVYGMSLYLLGAVFSSVTHLLLMLAKNTDKENKQINKEKKNNKNTRKRIKKKQVLKKKKCKNIKFEVINETQKPSIKLRLNNEEDSKILDATEGILQGEIDEKVKKQKPHISQRSIFNDQKQSPSTSKNYATSESETDDYGDPNNSKSSYPIEEV